MKALAISVAAITLLAVTPTHAQELGSVSTGNVSISVTIGPIGATIAAAQTGAKGLWSFNSNNQGLMVNIPATATQGQTQSLSLYAVHSAPLRVRSNDLNVSRGETNSDRGLERIDFSLNAPTLNTDKNSLFLTIYGI